MSLTHLTRRGFLAASASTALAAASPSIRAAPSTLSEQKLDTYIAAYMASMNAPGLTLALTDTQKTLRTPGYGFANLEARLPVAPDHLFQIGSISKSFVALVLLQLHDEGKLDLHMPILDYLPWLPIAERFAPITIHHLLTHTSGLPNETPVYPSSAEARHVQGFAPGEHFHYCNLGFVILGQLAAHLDNRPWHAAVKARIFDPLAMHDSFGVITTANRARAATGYEPFWDDQVYPRQGRLVASGNLVMDAASGSIQSTPGDMAKYARMLLNRGQHPAGRIVSEAGFTLFSTPWIKAEEFSPTASYGYGIAVDTLEGRKILRHTGGMIAFASSIHVDLDAGVAAFASINAMQGYRPTPVTEYAVRLLQAERTAQPLPTAPPLSDPAHVPDAADYAQTYQSPDGPGLTIKAEGQRLFLVHEGQSIPLEKAGRNVFFSTVPGQFTDYPLLFTRVEGAVTELSYGPQWWVGPHYTGPRTWAVPTQYQPYPGHYRSDSNWGGDVRVYLLKDKLYLNQSELTPIGSNLFRRGEDTWSPDTVEFFALLDQKSRVLKIGQLECWRIEIP